MRQTPHAGISCENDLGQLMAGVGNHEGKAIVLGGMQPGLTYGPAEMHHDLFVAPQGDRPAHIGSPSNQLDYCTQSFEPAGLVRLAPTGSMDYRLTKLGKVEGKAWAGHMLALSLEAEDISLRSLYGLTKSNRGKGSRPPQDRLRIFRLLLESEHPHASDVQAALGVPSQTAVNNLRWLDRDGIIEYASVSGGEIDEHITYGLPDTFELNGSKEGSMPHMVHATVKALVEAGRQECSLAEFRRLLAERYTDAGFERPNRQSYAAMVLNQMARDRHIKKGSIGGPHRSVITLPDSTRPIIEQAVALADGMLSGSREFMREGHDLLEDILGDEERVRTLVKKAFKASPTANRIPVGRRITSVEEVLADGPASSGVAAARLELEHGMTRATSMATLRMMRRSGQVVSERIDGTKELSWDLTGKAARSLQAA